MISVPAVYRSGMQTYIYPEPRRVRGHWLLGIERDEISVYSVVVVVVQGGVSDCGLTSHAGRRERHVPCALQAPRPRARDGGTGALTSAVLSNPVS